MTQYIKGGTVGRTGAAAQWGVRDLRRRPQVFSGHGVYEIKLFADDEAVIVPDEPFEWLIPPDLHLAGLIEVYAFVSTVSGGDIELEVVREPVGGGGDVSMFTSNLVIASGNKNSDITGGADPVDVDHAQVTKGDHLRCDIIDPGSGAMGLGLICVFLPDKPYTVMVEGFRGTAGADGADGADGAPGGITSWTGQWTTSTAYTVNQAVSNNGSSYVAISNHTSGALTEPGVGANWQTVWMLLAEGTGDAVDVSITDTGGYYTGTDVETALAEIGAALGAGADPIAQVYGSPASTFEFATSSLTGITSMNSPGTLDANTTVPGHLYIDATGVGFTFHGCYVTAPSMPFTAITRIKWPSRTSNYLAGMGVAVATPGAIDLLSLHIVSSVRGVTRFTYSDPTGSPSGSQAMTQQDQMPVYLAIAATSSTNISSYVSWDGYLWTKIANAVNPGFTIARVVLGVDKANSAKNPAAFEFLRFFSSALTFPGI